MSGVRLIHEIRTAHTEYPMSSGLSPVSALAANQGDSRSRSFTTSQLNSLRLLVRSRRRRWIVDQHTSEREPTAQHDLGPLSGSVRHPTQLGQDMQEVAVHEQRKLPTSRAQPVAQHTSHSTRRLADHGADSRFPRGKFRQHLMRPTGAVVINQDYLMNVFVVMLGSPSTKGPMFFLRCSMGRPPIRRRVTQDVPPCALPDGADPEAAVGRAGGSCQPCCALPVCSPAPDLDSERSA
jgi:hypothetical protein